MPRIVAQTSSTQRVIKVIKGMADTRAFKRVRVMTGGVMQTVWTSITAALDKNALSASTAGASDHGAVTSGSSVTCTVTGGTSPFAYSWVFESGDNTVVPTAATSAATMFTKPDCYDGYENLAVYHCHVVDSTGSTVDSGTVTVRLRWISTI